MTLHDLNAALKIYFRSDNEPLSLDKALVLSERVKEYYAFLLDDENSSEKNIKDEELNAYQANKKRFWFEIMPMIHFALYLRSIGNGPAAIIFCSHKEEYEGVFRWKDGKEVRLEITRALGKEGGQYERLSQEMLQKYGWAPAGQEIKYEGSQHKRKIDPNKNELRVYRNRYSLAAQIIKIKNENGNLTPEYEHDHFSVPLRLKQAFELKNKVKYQEYWFIITIPGYCGADEFFEGCSIFWDKIGEDPGIFKRVFVVNENYIKCANNEIKDNSILDSDNLEHYMPHLFSKVETEFKSTNGQRMWKFLLHHAKDDFLIKNIHEITEWLYLVKSHTVQDEQDDFWKIYDRLLRVSKSLNYVESLDLFHDIWNHPVGKLTLVAAELALEKNKEAYIKLSILIKTTNHNQKFILAAVAYYFSLLDKGWVKQHMLQHLKWNPNNQKIQYIWQAFVEGIYSKQPMLDCKLFFEIKQDFLEAIKHLSHKETHQKLCYILMYFFFYEDKYFRQTDLSKEFLKNLDIEKLEHISYAIFQLLDAAGEKSSELWKSKIDNWLKSNWPKREKLLNPTISDNFVETAIESRSAFGEAVKTLLALDLLTTSPKLFIFINKLINSNIPNYFPTETLVLLDKICSSSLISSNSIFSGKKQLREILWVIKNEYPEISNNQLYMKLIDYAQS